MSGVLGRIPGEAIRQRRSTAPSRLINTVSVPRHARSRSASLAGRPRKTAARPPGVRIGPVWPRGARLAGSAERGFCLFGQRLSGRMATSMIDLAARNWHSSARRRERDGPLSATARPAVERSRKRTAVRWGRRRAGPRWRDIDLRRRVSQG